MAGPVLLIHDDVTVIAPAKRVLQREGIESVLVGNAADAILAFGHSAPSVVVLAPEVDGHRGASIYREIRAHPNGANVPFVILGLPLPEAPESAVIGLPLDGRALLEAIDAAQAGAEVSSAWRLDAPAETGQEDAAGGEGTARAAGEASTEPPARAADEGPAGRDARLALDETASPGSSSPGAVGSEASHQATTPQDGSAPAGDAERVDAKPPVSPESTGVSGPRAEAELPATADTRADASASTTPDSPAQATLQTDAAAVAEGRPDPMAPAGARHGGRSEDDAGASTRAGAAPPAGQAADPGATGAFSLEPPEEAPAPDESVEHRRTAAPAPPSARRSAPTPSSPDAKALASERRRLADEVESLREEALAAAGERDKAREEAEQARREAALPTLQASALRQKIESLRAAAAAVRLEVQAEQKSAEQGRDAAREELEALRQQCAELVDQRSAAEAAKQAVEGDRQSLEQARDAVRKEVEAARAALAKAREEKHVAEVARRRCDEERATLEQSREEARRELESLREACSLHREELAGAHASRDAVAQEREAAAAARDEARAELETARTQAAKLRREVQALKADRDRMQEEREHLRQAQEAAAVERRALAEAQAAAGLEIESLRDQSERLAAERDAALAARRKAAEEREALERETNAAREQAGRLAAELAEASSQLEALERRHLEATAALEQLEQRRKHGASFLEEIERERSEASAKLEQLEQRRRDAAGALEESERRRVEASAAADELERRRGQLAAGFEEAERRRSEAAAAVETLEQRRGILAREIEELEKQREHVSAQAQAAQRIVEEQRRATESEAANDPDALAPVATRTRSGAERARRLEAAEGDALEPEASREEGLLREREARRDAQDQIRRREEEAAAQAASTPGKQGQGPHRVRPFASGRWRGAVKITEVARTSANDVPAVSGDDADAARGFKTNAPAEATAAPPELPEHGTLAELDFAGLICRAFDCRLTGRIDVLGSDAERTVWFEEGRLVAAQSTSLLERVEEVALRLGLVTGPQHHALRTTDEPFARRLALHMVELGYIRAGEMYPLVRRRVEEIAWSLFLDSSSPYRYRAEAPPAEERVVLPAHPYALATEGIRRKYSVERLYGRLGGPSSLLRPRTPPLDLDYFGLSARERRLAERVDGLRTLEEVLFEGGLEEAASLKVLYALVAAGALEIAVLGQAGRTPSRAEGARLDLARIAEKYSQVLSGDYFQMLGLRRDASAYEVREAYERLSRDFSPDRGCDDPAILKRLQEIVRALAEAADVLADDGVREEYARSLAD